jgi:hypothetical protein
LAVCTLLALASSARAERVTLAPLKDNTIFSESNNRSNGAGSSLFAGNTNTPATRRALLAFDLAASVPAGATITGATLELHVTMTMAGAQTISLNRLLADWGEGTSNANDPEGKGALAAAGDATWHFRFFADREWSKNGGDFAAAASASASAGATGSTVLFGSTPQMVADVQGWLDDPSANFGWIVRGNEGQSRTTKRFASRENGSASLRPKLTVDFQPPAEVPTASPTATIVSTATTTATQTPSATPPPSNTPSATPTATATVTATASPTNSASPSPRATSTRTPLPTDTATATRTHTTQPTETQTQVPPTATSTATIAVPSATPSVTAPSATTTAQFTPTASPTFTATIGQCTGDCDFNGIVDISELITCVSIALGTLPPSACVACDPSKNGAVEINELIGAVNDALNGVCLAKGAICRLPARRSGVARYARGSARIAAASGQLATGRPTSRASAAASLTSSALRGRRVPA